MTKYELGKNITPEIFRKWLDSDLYSKTKEAMGDFGKNLDWDEPIRDWDIDWNSEDLKIRKPYIIEGNPPILQPWRMYAAVLGEFAEHVKDGKVGLMMQETEERRAKDEFEQQKHQTKIKDMVNTKRIILIGSTGNGKSTVANVLLNKNGNFEEVFKESADSTSETRNIQIEKAEINLDNDGNEKLEMIIIDTVGIGDTKLTTQGVLYRLAEATSHIGEGLNQIFFVNGGRFTEKEEEAYKLLSSVIFDNEVVKYTTIVRTKFPEFESEEACKRDREKLRNEKTGLANIAKSVKIIHVENPPMIGRVSAIALAKEIREDSRKVLITHLGTCQNVYKPNNLNKLNDRIKNYMTEKERLEKEIAEKERLMKEQEQRMSRKIDEARESGNRQVRELEQRKAQQIREIEQNSERQISSLRDQNSSASYTISQLRSKANENDGVSSALSSFYGLSDVQGTDFSSKSLASRVYYLKGEFERVAREKRNVESNRDYWRDEEGKERRRAQEAESSRDWWKNEEYKERQRANKLEAKIEEYRSMPFGRALFPF